MKERTHYDVLGVPRNADPKEIKNAYREIAKEHHPDVGRGGDAERFHEAQEAYEVLSDRSSRERYDSELAGREAFRNAGPVHPDGTFFTDLDLGRFRASSRRETSYADLDPLFGSILEELFGFSGSPFADPFLAETGSGPFAAGGPFRETAGAGRAARVRFGGAENRRRYDAGESAAPIRLRITLTPREAERGVDAEIEIPVRTACPRCRALGGAFGRYCPICGGSGVVERDEPYTLEIPPGTPHGAQRSFRLEKDRLQTEVEVTVLHETRT